MKLTAKDEEIVELEKEVDRLTEELRVAQDCKIHPGEQTLKCRVCVGEDKIGRAHV